jgi:hypothetical protein
VSAPQHKSNFFPRTALTPARQFLRRRSGPYKEQYSESHTYATLAEMSSLVRPPPTNKACCTDEILRDVSMEQPNHHKFTFQKQRCKMVEVQTELCLVAFKESD